MNPKRFLIVLVTFIGGLYFFLEFLLPEEIGGYKFGRYHEQIILGVRIVGSMAFGLGIINIVQVHGGRILRAQSGWENSAALILGFFVMLAVDGSQFFYGVKRSRSVEELDHLSEYVQHVEEERVSGKLALLDESPVPAEFRIRAMLPVIVGHHRAWSATVERSKSLTPEQQQKASQVLAELTAAKEGAEQLAEAYKALSHKTPTEPAESYSKPLMQKLKGAAQIERELSGPISNGELTTKMSHLLYDGFFTTLASAMFSLLAFYIAGAAYRAFRVRSMEASMLMLTATLMILGQVPQGRSISEKLPLVRLWLLEYVNTPGNRAIYFGSAIAGLAMAVRMWLSLERSPLESTAEENA